MRDAERRSGTRHEISLPAVVEITSCSLECGTVDVSRAGLLVHTTTQLTVLVHFEGKQYRGHLVRAMRLADHETTAYAIELHDCIHELDPPVRKELSTKVLQWLGHLEHAESLPTVQATAGADSVLRDKDCRQQVELDYSRLQAKRSPR